MELEVSSTTKEETRCARSELMETYSTWTYACNQSLDALSLFFIYWNSQKAWILWIAWCMPHLLSRKNQTLQDLKKEILSSGTSRASPLRRHGSFHRGLLGRKILSRVHRRQVKRSFHQDTETRIWGCGRDAGGHYEGAAQDSSITDLSEER